MPRLDNDNERVLRYFEFELGSFDDPADIPPIDVCNQCDNLFAKDVCRIEHPPYEGMDPKYAYTCWVCGLPLAEEDD